MRQVPRRHIPVAIAGSTEVGVGPVNLGLSGAGGVEGGAGVAVQKHVIPSWLAGLDWGRLRHGVATASGASQQSGPARLVPEQIGAAAAGILGQQMPAGLEQATALNRKQRGAADRQLGTELLSGEQGIRGGTWQQGLPMTYSAG